MVESALILAQRDVHWGNLFYLLFVVLLPLLGGLGKWIRDRSAKKDEEGDAESLRAPQEPRARPTPERPVAPAARPVPRKPTPAAPLEAERSPEVSIAQVLDSAFPSRRPAPPRRAARVEPAAPPHRRQERPARPPRHAAPAPRPKRARRVSREEEVRALEKMMEQKEWGTPAPRRPAALDDWASLSIAELRRAIVLKEVLGAPVAIRGESHQF